MIVQDGTGRLHVAASGKLQLEVDPLVLALLLQRGNLRTKPVCRLSVLGGVCDPRFQLFDPGIAFSQLRLVCSRVNAACASADSFRALGVLALRCLRFLPPARLLLRLLLLPFDLLRLRAILLIVHVRHPFIQTDRTKNARTITMRALSASVTKCRSLEYAANS